MEKDKSNSLWALTTEFQRIMGLILDADGEIAGNLEMALTVNQELLAKKADSYDFICSKLEAEENYWKLRANDYLAVARACAHTRERLRSGIKNAMQAMGKEEITGENVTFKLANIAPKLVIENESAIPKEYVTETIVREPNKEAIKTSLKLGINVDGTRLEPVVALRMVVARKTK